MRQSTPYHHARLASVVPRPTAVGPWFAMRPQSQAPVLIPQSQAPLSWARNFQ